MKLAACFALATVVATTLSAQTPFPDPANLRGERPAARTGRELPIQQGALGLQEQLRKLRTRASLMLIVAHPDDEDGGMLTLYSRGQGARVANLTLTRGEGGQNAMTGDFEDALGLIRTQELLSADRYFGVDQMFGTEVDFGFSKTKEEAFQKWTHERVLYDAVRAVRLYRPLVIAAVFVGGVTDGHGHHQVSGEIAQEVFKAAADPKIFPELSREGILPWAPLKVYARVPTFAITSKGLFDYATSQYTAPSFTNYVTGSTTDIPPSPDVTVHEGEVDPLLTSAAADRADLPTGADPGGELSYVQFARLGLGLQRTQIGPGIRVASSGAYDVSYHRYGSRLAHQPLQESSFFDGIDTSLAGIATLSTHPPAKLSEGLGALSRAVASVSRSFDPGHLEASGPALVHAQHELGALLYSLETADFPGKADILHELRVKQVQLNDAIVLALGLQLHATAELPGPEVVQGSQVSIKTTLSSGTAEPVGVYAEALRGPTNTGKDTLLSVDRELVLTRAQTHTESLQAGPEATADATRPYFHRKSIEQPFYDLGVPTLRNAPATPYPLTAWATLRYHETEVQIGATVLVGGQALSVVPSASVALPSHAQVLTPERRAFDLAVQVIPEGTRVTVKAPPSWQISMLKEQDAIPKTPVHHVQAPDAVQSPVTLQAIAFPAGGEPQSEGYRTVGYGTLPRTNLFTPATLKLVPVSLQLPRRRRIAYLPGTGDAVADNLRSLGLPVTDIGVADLASGRLAAFDIVILGVRTYNAHPDLHGRPTEALLDFARHGGNVVVQYQTAEFTEADAPYPLSLGNAEKVVEETDPVQVAEAPSLLMQYPNHITAGDFRGWVEERGHGFLHDWDPRYVAPTETHDPGQGPQRGGLISTQLGSGHWTYCAFALYRQLPEAVPGAFRLLSNLLGLADATQP